jgi:hypothetical protein
MNNRFPSASKYVPALWVWPKTMMFASIYLMSLILIIAAFYDVSNRRTFLGSEYQPPNFSATSCNQFGDNGYDKERRNDNPEDTGTAPEQRISEPKEVAQEIKKEK